MTQRPHLCILGTRGIPARHGGFETFAEHLALYLVDHDWAVTVFCQADESTAAELETWRGIELVKMKVLGNGPLASILFDFMALIRALRKRDALLLTLGYNTAVFMALSRLCRRANIVNMDGLEWRRSKWSRPVRAWFWVNEWLGCWLGSHLIADHPSIADHLATRIGRRKISVIPYGADTLASADRTLLDRFGVEPGGYALVIARPEPENCLLEIASAFSARPRNQRLLVLGRMDDTSPYHRKVLAAASLQVSFMGAIYDKQVLAALRVHAAAYLHGHQVGGTNPSLVEALGAGCPIIAHNNRFNRWVAGPDALYFDDVASCAAALDVALARSGEELAGLRDANRRRQARLFAWPNVLASYEALLASWWRADRKLVRNDLGPGRPMQHPHP